MRRGLKDYRMTTSGRVGWFDSSIFPDEEGTESACHATLRPVCRDSSIFPDEEGTESCGLAGGDVTRESQQHLPR